MAALVAIALLAWFAIAALATPFDHDESQYIAGAYFSGRMLIFRDFLYLQPPLHSWIFAPLGWLFPVHMVPAMRLATAATALATLAAIWGGQRIAGISRAGATVATLLVATTAAFQFTATVVRNDMLPTLLSASAMALTLLALRDGTRRHWFSAGIVYGLAISTKLNFAPLGLTVGLFVISTGGRCGLRAAVLLATGALVGMMPMAVAWALAPEGFTYGVLGYGMTAPHAWYAANGAARELAVQEKVADLLKYLWKGPALAGLLLLMANWIATRKRVRSPGRRMAIWMTVGALIGAALPTPSQLQYLMPLLPPLALALGYMLDDARRWTFARREALLALLSLAALPGLQPTMRDLRTMMREGSEVLRADADARWAAGRVRALSGGDTVLTLAPHRIIGGGLAIDRRTATGPFVYRTGWTISPAQARRLHALTPATLADLDRDPPAAILVGYENGTRKLPLRPDAGLARYARLHGYRAIAMPDGIGLLYLRARRVDSGASGG